MKKLLFVAMMMLLGIAAHAQKSVIDTLKARQEVLKITTQLNEAQLDYQKEKAKYADLIKEVDQLNAKANAATADFNTSNASNTVKDASATMKKLKDVKKANKKLAKSQKCLQKYEKKIAKLQNKLDKLNKRIQFINQ